MNSSSKDIEIKNLISEMNGLKSSLKFVYEKEQVAYERVVDLHEILFYKTKRVLYLIDLCRLEKRMLGITSRSKRVSKQAFIFSPSEKTLHFFLLNHLTNKNAREGLKLLDENIFITPNKNLQAIRDLYYGSIAGLDGNYYLYSKLICKAKKNYSPGIYYQLMNVVSEYELGENDALFLNKKYRLSPKKIPPNSDFIFSISCDMRYFELYAPLLIDSFFHFNQNAVIHIYVVNCRDSSEVTRVSDKFKDRVLLSFFDCPDNIDYRPISAVLRLLAINDLIETYKKPVVFGEIDGLITGPFSKIIDLAQDGSAQLVRLIGVYLPWQRFTCGLGVFMPTPAGIRAARLLCRYVKGIFNRTEKHWWADQCALEGAIRYSMLVDSDYEFKAIPMGLINEIFFTPTGSDDHDKKTFLLKKKCAGLTANEKDNPVSP
jgi:hypothetical protein